MNAKAIALFAAACAALLPAATPCSAAAPAAVTPLPQGVDLSSLDRKVSPCDDFYQYACGGWLAAHPIPADRSSWGRFDELQERNLAVLRSILDQRAADSPQRTPVQRQIGDFYAACMDEAGIEAKGTAPLQPDLDRIAALTDKAALPDLVAHLHAIGANVLFGFSSIQDFKNATAVIAAADQGGLGLPDRDYYLKDDPKSAEQRKLYVEHVRRMLALAGAPADRAAADAAAVMGFETGLAKVSLDLVSRRDPQRLYHKLAVEDVQALTPGFSWERYLHSISAPATAVINITVPDYFRGMDALLAATDLPTLRAYLRWQLVHATAELLPKAFVDESFAFYGKTLAGIPELQPRWKRCVQRTDAGLGEALGQEFVERTFGHEGKARTRAMVQAIEAALKQDIETLPWMTPTTRRAAVVKLAGVANKIGYPDRWRDYGSVRVDRHDALGNFLRAGEFEFQRQLKKVGQPVDRGEWVMTPPTVNAYYNPLMNDINFPAGILQPPFYAPAADTAYNLGAIGAVIGHELTHGFDDSGRQFAANGNLEDWWTSADAKEFEQRATCIADQYGRYTAAGDLKVNGRLTLGENVADNGGLRIAYRALQATLAGKPRTAVGGFTPEQRFFLGWGEIWCESQTLETERLLTLTNPHSPSRYRVDGVVSNIPEFQQAFQCKPGAPMAPASRCRVW